ncbi:MBOAT family O-acyltransferase, partial [Helicobacter canis]|uniref:MBOAT family O-acyltransferase n=1 Tax=Helicobacter canis TaxID=29419 RepID=UPI0029436C85
LGLLFGIVLPINFSSPYKALNIATFWRKWHITLGRFLKEYLYIPLGGNQNLAYRQSRFYMALNNLLTLRNLFIVAFLSGVWHGAGWGFVIWGSLHGVAMVVHRIYMLLYKKLDSRSRDSACSDKGLIASRSLRLHTASMRPCERSQNKPFSSTILESQINSPKIAQNKGWYLRFMQTRIYIVFCWILTFNFINIAWVFFRAENLQGAVNLLQGMFGGEVVWLRLMDSGTVSTNSIEVWGWVFLAFILALACKNSIALSAHISKVRIIFAGVGCAICLLKIIGDSGASSPFLYFNF